jgi:Acyl-CoA thioester hydrolase/BAAT N-terminal region
MAGPQPPSDAPAATTAVPPSKGRSGPGRRGPYITVPDQLLVDEPGGATISGCEPGQAVTVTATSQISGFVHEATATFTADGTGTVDTARQPATVGSYTGIDPFGLWWSATPARACRRRCGSCCPGRLPAGRGDRRPGGHRRV